MENFVTHKNIHIISPISPDRFNLEYLVIANKGQREVHLHIVFKK